MALGSKLGDMFEGIANSLYEKTVIMSENLQNQGKEPTGAEKSNSRSTRSESSTTQSSGNSGGGVVGKISELVELTSQGLVIQTQGLNLMGKMSDNLTKLVDLQSKQNTQDKELSKNEIKADAKAEKPTLREKATSFMSAKPTKPSGQPKGKAGKAPTGGGGGGDSGGLAGMLKMAVGLPLALLGFAAAFIGVDKLAGTLGSTGENLVPIVTNIVAALNELGKLSMGAITVVGGLVAASVLLEAVPGVSAKNIVTGMGAAGFGLAGFMIGLATPLQLASNLGLGDGAAMIPFATNTVATLNEIGKLSAGALGVIGTIVGTSVLLTAAPAIGGIKGAGAVALGMTAAGVGLAGFMIGLAAPIKLASELGIGDGSELIPFMTNTVLALNNLGTLSGGSLAVIGTILAVSGGAVAIGAALGGPVGALLGAGAAIAAFATAGIALGAFLVGLGGAAKLASKLGIDGSSSMTLIGNISDGINAAANIKFPKDNFAGLSEATKNLKTAIDTYTDGDMWNSFTGFISDTWSKVKGFFGGGDKEEKKQGPLDDLLNMFADVDLGKVEKLDKTSAALLKLVEVIKNFALLEEFAKKPIDKEAIAKTFGIIKGMVGLFDSTAATSMGSMSGTKTGGSLFGGSTESKSLADVQFPKADGKSVLMGQSPRDVNVQTKASMIGQAAQQAELSRSGGGTSITTVNNNNTSSGGGGGGGTESYIPSPSQHPKDFTRKFSYGTA